MDPKPAPDADLAGRIIDLAMQVHGNTGPGLYAAAYQQCLCHELSRAGIAFQEHVPLPIRYGGAEIESGFLADVIVQNEVILHLKAVDEITPLHDTELFTYLTLSECRVGLMINFNTVSPADGIRRRVR
jgi:GxxExxY protein